MTRAPLVTCSASASAWRSHAVHRHQVGAPSSAHWPASSRLRCDSATENDSSALPLLVNFNSEFPTFPVNVISAILGFLSGFACPWSGLGLGRGLGVVGLVECRCEVAAGACSAFGGGDEVCLRGWTVDSGYVAAVA